MPRLKLGPRITTTGLVAGAGWIVQLACVAIVLYVLVNAIWYFVSGPTIDDAAAQQSHQLGADRRKVDIKRILETDLFGTQPKDDLESLAEDLKETTLNLTLNGTVVVTDQRTESLAFIANQDGRRQNRLYQQGDAIASFARIEEIHARFVVISRGGERERLTFEGEDVFKEATPAHSQISPGDKAVKTAATQSMPSESRVSTQSLKTASVEDLKRLGLAEVQTNQGASLAIVDSEGTSALARLGMQPGDIVLAVNDHSLSELRADEELAERILASNTAKLTIKRANREFILTVPMPQ